MAKFFGHCCGFYDPISNYVEGFFDREDHQEVDENFGWDTSLYVLDPEVNLLGSIEEHNASFFTTLVRNQVLSSGISHKKVDVLDETDPRLPSQIFLENHLHMVLEEW